MSVISVEKPLKMRTMNISELGGKQISGCISSVYRREGVSRMLHVIDNYYAQTNNYGYSVLRDTGKQNPKTGEQTYIPLGYVGTIKEALELVKKDIVHNHIKANDMELAQALGYIREQTDRILKAMVGIDI